MFTLSWCRSNIMTSYFLFQLKLVPKGTDPIFTASAITRSQIFLTDPILLFIPAKMGSVVKIWLFVTADAVNMGLVPFAWNLRVPSWRECCSVLQCIAVCCSVLQCVAVCCSVLQCVAVCCRPLDADCQSHGWFPILKIEFLDESKEERQIHLQRMTLHYRLWCEHGISVLVMSLEQNLYGTPPHPSPPPPS